MTELGTVVGNVSRTHRPCGACAELVERCGHWHPGYVAPPSNPRRKADAEYHRAARARAKADVAAFRAEQLGALPQ